MIVKYIVDLTYTVQVIMEAPEAGTDQDLALEAEKFAHPSRYELTDWNVRPADPRDKREADNV